MHSIHQRPELQKALMNTASEYQINLHVAGSISVPLDVSYLFIHVCYIVRM